MEGPRILIQDLLFSVCRPNQVAAGAVHLGTRRARQIARAEAPPDRGDSSVRAASQASPETLHTAGSQEVWTAQWQAHPSQSWLDRPVSTRPLRPASDLGGVRVYG